MANPTALGSLAYPLDAPHSRLWEAGGLQRGRKLQRLTFRYKRGLRQECIPIRHDGAAASVWQSDSVVGAMSRFAVAERTQ